jgi:uncharacterized protein (DUF433 family)
MSRASEIQEEAKKTFLANYGSFTADEIATMLKHAARHMNKSELTGMLEAIDKTWDDLEY